MKRKIISIKDEFIRKSTPGIGRVTLDINLNINRHINEINTALWLKETFGGNIKVLQEKSLGRNVRQPGYIWNDEYWELKNCTTLRSIDNRLHKAMKQINNKNYTGGIILSIFNHENTKK